MSKLERITAFIAVVEQNGFAAAARKEGLSTAAISRQVARLESDLNVELVQRTTRQISLTEIGAEYYRQVKKVLADLTEAEVAISNSQSEPTGLLTVMSNQYFAIKYLIPRLPEFMLLNPKLHVNIELAERFPDLKIENIDLIFGVSMEGPLALVRRQVASTRYILCASPAYVEKYGEPRLPSDLSGHQYITHSMRKPDNVITLKNNKEIYVKPTLWLNDSRAMCECAIQGMGVVRLHDYIVADALAAGRLVELLPEYIPFAHEFSAFMLSLFSLSVRLKTLNRAGYSSLLNARLKKKSNCIKYRKLMCKGYSERKQPIYLYYQQSRYLQPKIRRFIDFYTSSL